MSSIGLSCFLLGLAAACVSANQTLMVGNMSYPTILTPLQNTSYVTTATNTTNTTNVTEAGSTMSPQMSTQIDGDNKTQTSFPSTTPKTTVLTKSTTPTTTRRRTTTTQPQPTGNDSTGIIILVVIVVIAIVFGVACFFARKRGQRYSVDFNSRPDEANIPLSTMDPVEVVPLNGLQTFESAEPPKEQTPEPEEKPDGEKEQKAEADKSVVDASAASAAPAAPPDVFEDKPKEDVAEPSPPAPVEQSAGEKTDDEGAVSNKTSVESLKEANENNSNNTDLGQQRDLKRSNFFWDVPLHCPV